jgi:hypothetical protein
MALLPDWRAILRRAWSIRLMLLAAVLSGVEVVLPLFAHLFPHGTFAALSFLAVAAALVARLVAQKS